MNKDESFSSSDLHVAEWLDRLQDFVDGALAPQDAVAVQVHLAACSMCSAQQRSLLALDRQLREQFDEMPTLTNDFERNVFAKINEIEQHKRNLAKQREQQEYEARRSQSKGIWRHWAHLQLGNVIGIAATIGAVTLALRTLWPKSVEPAIEQRITQWGSEIPASLLPGHGLSGQVLAVVIASAIAAAAAIWLVKAQEQRSS